MDFVLVRHGQPEWVLDGFNVDNPPLTERGHRQATAMAEALALESFDEVHCSPLVRARQTAAPLFERIGRQESVEPFLEEIRNPIWHGTPAEKADAAYKADKARPAVERWQGIEGGEPVNEFVARIHAGATEFLARHGVRRIDHELPVWEIDEPGQRLAFVAHAGTNSVLICHLLGLAPTPWEWERFVIGHASISRVSALRLGDGWTFSLTRLSDCEHLGTDDRTL